MSAFQFAQINSIISNAELKWRDENIPPSTFMYDKSSILRLACHQQKR
jgi:hypothetical protein